MENDATRGLSLPISEDFGIDVRKCRQRNGDIFADVCCVGERRIVERVLEISRIMNKWMNKSTVKKSDI